MVMWVLFSIPLEALTRIVSGETKGFICVATRRIQWEGTTMSTRSFPDTAFSMSLVGIIPGGRLNPGRKLLFSR